MCAEHIPAPGTDTAVDVSGGTFLAKSSSAGTASSRWQEVRTYTFDHTIDHFSGSRRQRVRKEQTRIPLGRLCVMTQSSLGPVASVRAFQEQIESTLR